MWKESDDNILDEEKITRKFMPAAQIRRLWKGRVIVMKLRGGRRKSVKAEKWNSMKTEVQKSIKA